jgi:hypothetical protein
VRIAARRRKVLVGAGLALAAAAAIAWIVASWDRLERPPGAMSGTTYYVRPGGSDANPGTSPGRAWATVERATHARLRPGDAVLFQGGAEFADAPLEPHNSGTGETPIVYGSFGGGRARLRQPVVLSASRGIVVQDLEIKGVDQGIVSSASSSSGSREIVIQRNRIADAGIAINSANAGDADWTVRANEIQGTRDSGLIVLAERARIEGNTISETGLDTGISYGKHGIYLKGANGEVVGNRIRDARDGSAVTVRRRDSLVENNDIQGGKIGISWFQEDPKAGTSRWVGNRIAGTERACIYVSPSDAAGKTRESFEITGNRLSPAAGGRLNLAPTSGSYTVRDNTGS